MSTPETSRLIQTRPASPERQREFAACPADKQVVVLMSGGVDSSVAACLLLEQGFAVTGLTMQVPILAEGSASTAVADASSVCAQLGIAHYRVDVASDFHACVVSPFQADYFAGRTPNPCVDCNARIKFGLLWDLAESELGISSIATGHYALAVREHGRTYLRRGPNHQKDQTYFLYGISARRLPHFYLPLMAKEKDEVRKMAADRGLSVAQKAESMDICFAAEGDYRAILPQDAPCAPGDFLDFTGKVVGRHEGIQHYTIGQRKGLGIALGYPAYVLAIDPARNTVTLGPREEAMCDTITAEKLNLLLPEELGEGVRLWAKIRSVGDPQPCAVVVVEKNAQNGGSVCIRFDNPVFAPTPGQHLVLYDQDENVVAGGTICINCG